MANQIDDYVKRPFRYQNIDGLGELGIGIMWTVFILLGLLLKTAPSGSFWQVFAAILVCLAALSFGILYAHRALKRRITYARTGYVGYRRSGKGVRLIAGVLAGMALGTLFGIFVRRFAPHSHEMALIVWTSAGWGILYVILTRMSAAWRWVALVGIIVAPQVVAMLPMGHLWAGYLPLALQGMIYTVSGAIALTLYLRRNPVAEQVAE